MYTAQETDFSHATFNSKTCFFLDYFFIIAKRTFIIGTPPKATETAQVLTYVGHMQVLVFDISYNISCATLPHLICR